MFPCFQPLIKIILLFFSLSDVKTECLSVTFQLLLPPENRNRGKANYQMFRRLSSIWAFKTKQEHLFLMKNGVELYLASQPHRSTLFFGHTCAAAWMQERQITPFFRFNVCLTVSATVGTGETKIWVTEKWQTGNFWPRLRIRPGWWFWLELKMVCELYAYCAGVQLPLSLVHLTSMIGSCSRMETFWAEVTSHWYHHLDLRSSPVLSLTPCVHTVLSVLYYATLVLIAHELKTEQWGE